MTIQAMAQSALDVQNACNLSGVVRSFAEITSAMRTEHGMDTPTCNRHPVCILFAHKIADMVGVQTAEQGDTAAGIAMIECERMARQEPLKLSGSMMPLGGVQE